MIIGPRCSSYSLYSTSFAPLFPTIRLFAMKTVRDKLVRFDGAFQRMSTYGEISKGESIRSSSILSGSVRSSSIRSNSMRSSLSEPLIDDEEAGSSK